MAVVINGDTGVNKITDGSVTTADLASTLDLSGKTMTYGNLPAANLTGTLPAIDGSNLTGVSGGPVIKYVTDTTDISVTGIAGTAYSTIGSTFSVDIPTSGSFTIKQIVIKVRNDETGYANPTFGLRVGSTNYWFSIEDNTDAGTEITPMFYSHDNVLNNTTTIYSGTDSSRISNGVFYGSTGIRDIVESGIPTGTQTVQLIAARPNWVRNDNRPNYTILGSSVTTRVAIEFTEYS